MKVIVLLVGASMLSGCGGNQALLASGGHQDFAEMGRISEEYGSGDAGATVPVIVNGETYTFRIWVSKTRPKIMAQTNSMAGVAAAGFVRGLTAGLVKGDVEYEPIEQAALEYLRSKHGPNCTLTNSRKLTRVGWEWDFNCPNATKR